MSVLNLLVMPPVVFDAASTLPLPSTCRYFFVVPSSTVNPNGKNKFDGKLLGKEYQRRKTQDVAERLQKRAKGEILGRLFEEYPWNAFEIAIKKITLSKSNSDVAIVKLQASYKKSFIKALIGTLCYGDSLFN